MTRQSSGGNDVNVQSWDIDAFSERLSEAMEGRTPYSIQKETGIAQSLIGKYLKGLSTPGVDKLVLLANTLGVSVAWLASGQLPMRKPEGYGLVEEASDEDVASFYSRRSLSLQRQQAGRASRGEAEEGPERRHLVIPVTLYVRLIDPLKEMTSGEDEREWVMSRIGAVLDALTHGSTEDMLRLTQEELTHAVHLAAAAWRIERGKQEAQRRASMAREAEDRAAGEEDARRSQETRDALEGMKDKGGDDYF